jgi:hypothetical protein
MTEQVLTPASELALQNLLAAHGGCIHESQVVSLLGLKARQYGGLTDA